MELTVPRYQVLCTKRISIRSSIANWLRNYFGFFSAMKHLAFRFKWKWRPIFYSPWRTALAAMPRTTAFFNLICVLHNSETKYFHNETQCETSLISSVKNRSGWNCKFELWKNLNFTGKNTPESSSKRVLPHEEKVRSQQRRDGFCRNM